METGVPPLPVGQALPPRRKSLLAETSACDTCGKGATEVCVSCNRKICLGCLSNDGVCTSCAFIATLQMNKDKKSVVSKFSSFFKSNKVRPNNTSNSNFARTPDRQQSWMEAPASASKGFLGLFRRGSSSKNLMAYLDEEARGVTSPIQNADRPRRPAANSGTSDESSDEVMQRLGKELDRFRELNTKLQTENERLKSQLSETAPVTATTTTTTSSAPNTSAPSESELAETKARLADLRVELEEQQDRINRIGAELLAAQERERHLQAYLNTVLQQQQQGSGQGRGRSQIPPCVPFPNTAESREWLNAIRAGTHVNYWDTPAAQAVSCSDLPLPPPLVSSMIGAANTSSGGKKRSEVPPPPPLPPHLKQQAAASLANATANAAGRRGSAPGLLESVPHQKKRESVFSAGGQAKSDMKPLFWTALDQTRVQGTICERLGEKPVDKPEQLNAQLKTLATRFAKRAPKVDPKAAQQNGGAAPVVQAAPRLQIMDPKRKQQIGIGLSGSFRNVSLLELKKAIVGLDSSILTVDRVRMLLEMIPTQEEMTQLEGFRSGGMLDQSFFAGMSKEETFFVDMAAIPRLKQRLLCMLMEMSFDSSLTQLQEDIDTFAGAIKVLRESQNWKEFLGLLLETGNFLNEGNNGLGGAWGFSLKEGLKKFSEMKSCENNSRFSLMHWIAEVAALHKPELFSMVEEFAVVSDASTRSMEELRTEVGAIKRQLDIVKAEVDKSKMESSESSTKFLTKMVPFLENILLVKHAQLQSKLDEMEKQATQLVIMHGENPQQTTCQQLFHIILEGVTAFLKCNEENQAAKFAEQKAMLQQQNKANKAIPDGGENRAKRDQNRIMKDTGVASGTAKMELEQAMAKRRKAPA